MVVLSTSWVMVAAVAAWGPLLSGTSTVTLTGSSSHINTVQPQGSQSDTWWPDVLNPFRPSIGDVKLIGENGLVMLYFSDGGHAPSWGTICANSCGQPSAATVCKQLGYSDGSMINERCLGTKAEVSGSHSHPVVSLRSPVEGSKVWLDSLSCDSTHSHVLQCTYTVRETIDTTCENNNFLQVQCSNSKLEAYDGAVRLCRPASPVVAESQSVSMGLVQVCILKQGAKECQWAGINQHNPRHPLGTLEANTLCRQLGYTNAVASSAVTQGALTSFMSQGNGTASFDDCYNGAEGDANKQAWLTTDGLKCNNSDVCFGCCVSSYPSLCSNCNTSMDIVIRCTFDRTIFNDKDSPKNCTFNSAHKLLPSSCLQQVETVPLHTFEIVVGSVSSLFLLLFLILFGVLIAFCCYCYRQRRPNQGDGGQGRPNQGRGGHVRLNEQADVGN